MRRFTLRFFSFLLVFSLLLGPVPASVVSAEEPYAYEILEGKAVITLYNGTEETVTVPETLGDAPVAAIGVFAFEGASVKELILPSCLERIEDGAFFGCASLEKVTFGSGLLHVGEAAFADCTALTEAVLPASLQSLGSQAFSGCNGLTLLAVEEGCEAYRSAENCIIDGSGALVAGCGSSVIPDDGSVTSIALYAFSCIKSLTSIEIPQSVTAIGDGAFEGTSLTGIFLPSALKTVGKYVFHNAPLTALYCGSETKPEGWHQKWNGGVEVPPIWSYDNTCAHAETRNESLDPTCDTDGYRREVCNLCGSVLFLEVSDAYGHTEHTQTIPSTCAKAGYTRVFCTVCGEELSRKALPLSTVHGTTGTEALAPTCEKPGYKKEICTVCGKTMTTVTYPAKGHTVQTETVQPTCAADGYTRTYCGVCGKELSRTVLPMTSEHGALRTETAPPTCTGEGFIKHVCTVCGKTVSSDSVSPTGHSPQTETVQPTCAAAGYTREICTVCGEVLSYTEHPKTEDHPGFTTQRGEPTCTEAGFLRETCILCGKAVTETVLPALGHTYETKTVSPTCGKEGYVSVRCIACGEDKEYTKLLAVGHAYGEDGLCAYCGIPKADPAEDFTVMLYKNGLEIIGYRGDSTHVVIPAYIKGGAVIRIADGAFEKTAIESVTFPGTLQEIGSFAFAECTSLREIVLPSGVKLIGEGAFAECVSAERLYLPEGLESILYAAFAHCDSLTYIELPASLKELSPGAFFGCKGLTRLGVREGNGVFASDGNCILEKESGTLLMGCVSSVIPADGSVKHIASYAFDGVSGLTSLYLPEGILSLGAYAFRGTGLTSLRIPVTVESVGRYLLFDTPAQQVYVVPAEDPDSWHIHWIAGSEAEVIRGSASCAHGEQVLLRETAGGCISAGSRVYGCALCGAVASEEAVAPKGHTYQNGVCSACGCPEGLVLELQNGGYCITGYQGNAKILVLPAAVDGIPVTAVAEGAFGGNGSLKTVYLPDSLLFVGEGIFRDCNALDEIRMERICAPITWNESWSWGTDGRLLWNSEEPSSEPVLMGDLNMDGRVNVLDYGILKRYVMKLADLSPEQLLRADINGDGRINVLDYSVLKRQVMKL